MILKASFASPMKNMLAETIKEFIKEYCFQNNLTPFIKKLKKTSFIELIKKIKEEKNLILKEKIFNELNFNNILNELKDDYPQISLFSIEEIEKITKELSIPKEKVQIIKKKLEKNSNIRNILQILGTEILRENIDKDIHIGLFSLFLLKKIENIEKININTYMGLPGSGKDFVSVNLEKEKQKENELLIYFTDSRFLNEVFFIQSLKNTKNKTELIQILKEKIKTTNFNIKISEELENFFPFFKEYKKSLKLINKIKSESNI